MNKFKQADSPLLISEFLLFVYTATVVTLTAAVHVHMLSNLLGALMAAVFLLEFTFRKQLPKPSITVKPLLPLLCLMVMMALWLPFFPEALERPRSFFQILILMLVVLNVLRATGRTWPLEYGFLFGLVYIWQSGALSFHEAHASQGQRFFFSTTGFAGEDDSLNPNVYGLYCCAYILYALRFIFLVFLSQKKTLVRWGRAVIAGAGVLMASQQILTVTGSRKSMILLVVISIGTTFLFAKGRMKIARIVAGVIFGLGAAAFAIYKMQSSAYWQRLEELFYGLKGEESGDASFDTREEMIFSGIDLWLSSPLWGHGNEAFRVMSGFGTYSHSTPVELLSNYGIVGFVCYYLFYVQVFKRARALARSQNHHLSVAGAWVILSLTCLTLWSLAAVCYYEKAVALLLASLVGLAWHYRPHGQVVR